MDQDKPKKSERGTGDAGRCTKDRAKRRYTKKRRYHGKGNKKSTDAAAETVENLTVAPPRNCCTRS